MFKGLTQRAQKVLTILAQDEAKRFHSDQLLPEHIMLALLKFTLNYPQLFAAIFVFDFRFFD